MEIEEMKIKALANFLGEEDLDEIEEEGYTDNLFTYASEEYLVLTYEEMEELAKERILESLWAFNASFLIHHLKGNLTTEIIETIQTKLCEGANEVFMALLEDEDLFVNDAVSSDGYGHFLSLYDGEENEEVIENQTFHIFRQN